MHVSNFGLAIAVIDAAAPPHRTEIERDFRERYHTTERAKGSDHAETMALVEAKYWLLRADIHPDGYAYLHSQIAAR